MVRIAALNKRSQRFRGRLNKPITSKVISTPNVITTQTQLSSISKSNINFINSLNTYKGSNSSFGSRLFNKAPSYAITYLRGVGNIRIPYFTGITKEYNPNTNEIITYDNTGVRFGSRGNPLTTFGKIINRQKLNLTTNEEVNAFNRLASRAMPKGSYSQDIALAQSQSIKAKLANDAVKKAQIAAKTPGTTAYIKGQIKSQEARVAYNKTQPRSLKVNAGEWNVLQLLKRNSSALNMKPSDINLNTIKKLQRIEKLNKTIKELKKSESYYINSKGKIVTRSISKNARLTAELIKKNLLNKLKKQKKGLGKITLLEGEEYLRGASKISSKLQNKIDSLTFRLWTPQDFFKVVAAKNKELEEAYRVVIEYEKLVKRSKGGSLKKILKLKPEVRNAFKKEYEKAKKLIKTREKINLNLYKLNKNNIKKWIKSLNVSNLKRFGKELLNIAGVPGLKKIWLNNVNRTNIPFKENIILLNAFDKLIKKKKLTKSEEKIVYNSIKNMKGKINDSDVKQAITMYLITSSTLLISPLFSYLSKLGIVGRVITGSTYVSLSGLGAFASVSQIRQTLKNPTPENFARLSYYAAPTAIVILKVIGKLGIRFRPTVKNAQNMKNSLKTKLKDNLKLLKQAKKLKDQVAAKLIIDQNKELRKAISEINWILKNQEIIKAREFNPLTYTKKYKKVMSRVKDVYHISTAQAKKLFGQKIKGLDEKSILKKINLKNNTKAALEVRGEINKVIAKFIKEQKLIIGGSKAQNILVKKWYRRLSKDFDVLSSTPKKDITKLYKELKKLFPGRKIKIVKKTRAYTIKIDGSDFIDIVKKQKGLKYLTTKQGYRIVTKGTLVKGKLKTLSDPRFLSRQKKDIKDLIKISEGKLKKSDILKKRKNPSNVFEVTRQPGGMGKSRIKFGEDHLYWDFESALGYSQGKKYSIIKFPFAKISKFPKSLIRRINKAALGKLSSKQMIRLRKDLNAFIKKNPNKFFLSPRTASTILGEREIVTPVKSKFIKKNVYKTFDNDLQKFIDVIEVGFKKTKAKSLIKKFINGWKNKPFRTLRLRLTNPDLKTIRRYKKLLTTTIKLTPKQKSNFLSIFKKLIRKQKIKKQKTKKITTKRIINRPKRKLKRTRLKLPKRKTTTKRKRTYVRKRVKPRTRTTIRKRVKPRKRTIVRKRVKPRKRTIVRKRVRPKTRVKPRKRTIVRKRIKPRTRTTVRKRVKPRTRTTVRKRVKPRTRIKRKLKKPKKIKIPRTPTIKRKHKKRKVTKKKSRKKKKEKRKYTRTLKGTLKGRKTKRKKKYTGIETRR